MKRRLTRITLLTSLLLAATGCVPEDEAAAPGPTNPGAGPVGPIQGINVLSISEENGHTVEPDTVRIERVHLEDWPGYLAIHADEGGAPGAVLGVERVQPRRRNYVTVTLDAPLNARQTLWAVAYADIENTNTFSTDLPIAQGESSPLQAAFDLYFQSTTTVEDSPYYQNPCPFEQWREDPTDFFVDCRCSPNQVTLPICQQPSKGGVDRPWAEGPSLASLPFDSRSRGGAVRESTGEVIFGVRWQDENHTDPGVIMAIDYTTGNRRIISGRWKDPNAGYEVFGEGPELAEPIDLELGPDGAAYVWAWKDHATAMDGVSIMRVDLETGARTRVWGINNPAFGQCPNGAANETNTQFHKFAFTMDAQGNYYVATLKNGLPNSGRGIARIAPDGSRCEYVTMDGVAEGNDFYPGIGDGFPVGQFNYYGLEIHNGAIYSLNGGELIRVDLETGNRRRIAGDGAAPGSQNVAGYYLQYNPHWNLMMVSGMPGEPEFVGGTDLESGKVYTFASCLNIAGDNPFATDCFEGAAAPKGRSERQTWVLPNGNWLVSHGRGFAMVEPRTGNSYAFSN